ncbi:hypothetical protein Psuf_021600 [Phytohabitans suffuscus]|uniref:AB hydrolase-1 domain-containing protein n=1 Tax=Phytohabitans suffuscus TaxID=624315 RepID=A0A6F8YFJ8_9ACTN|nr:hypothetical protein Psuf_021600 [Phytohabitans suffuscus]
MGSVWRRRAARSLAIGLVCAVLGATPSPVTATASGAAPRLTGSQPCPGVTGFTCADLAVPLDRAGHAAGALRLRVAVADNPRAPRGTLLLLTGGPGQPGPGLLPRLRERFAFLLDDYRLVMIDQRGTGAGAIDCPACRRRSDRRTSPHRPRRPSASAHSTSGTHGTTTPPPTQSPTSKTYAARSASPGGPSTASRTAPSSRSTTA